MAIAGAMTTAYSLTPGTAARPNLLKTTYPSDKCTPPAEAVAQLRDWTPDARPVIVQGSDMTEFWRLWEGGE
jgi:hypothetical protein